jgi:hypothetical protein
MNLAMTIDVTHYYSGENEEFRMAGHLAKRFLNIHHGITWIKMLRAANLYLGMWQRVNLSIEDLRWLYLLKLFKESRNGNNPYIEFKYLREQGYGIQDFTEFMEIESFDYEFTRALTKFRKQNNLQKS